MASPEEIDAVVVDENGTVIKDSGGYLFLCEAVQQSPPSPQILTNNDDDNRNPGSPDYMNVSVNNRDGDDVIWSTRHSTPRDLEATDLFLHKLQDDKMKRKFRDKKTRKNSLWKELADYMANSGYNLGTKPYAKIECKYRNLGRTFNDFVHNANARVVGKGGRKEKPPNWNDICKAFGDGREESVTVLAGGSMDIPSSEDDTSTSALNDRDCFRGETSSKEETNREKRSSKAELMSAFLDLYNENAKRQDERFCALEELARKQIAQEEKRHKEMSEMLERQHADRQALNNEFLTVLLARKSKKVALDHSYE